MNDQITATNKLAVLPKTKKKSAKTSTNKKSLVIPKRTLLKISISALVLTILAGGVFGYTQAYDSKIYPKATIAGIKVGGLTVPEAKEKLLKKADELNQEGPVITYNEQTLEPTLEEMGVSFNIDKAISDAYKFGRKGSFIDRIKENWQMLIQSY